MAVLRPVGSIWRLDASLRRDFGQTPGKSPGLYRKCTGGIRAGHARKEKVGVIWIEDLK